MTLESAVIFKCPGESKQLLNPMQNCGFKNQYLEFPF